MRIGIFPHRGRPRGCRFRVTQPSRPWVHSVTSPPPEVAPNSSSSPVGSHAPPPAPRSARPCPAQPHLPPSHSTYPVPSCMYGGRVAHKPRLGSAVCIGAPSPRTPPSGSGAWRGRRVRCKNLLEAAPGRAPGASLAPCARLRVHIAGREHTTQHHRILLTHTCAAGRPRTNLRQRARGCAKANAP